VLLLRLWSEEEGQDVAEYVDVSSYSGAGSGRDSPCWLEFEQRFGEFASLA
jgi:hypothetical protein